MCTYWYFFPKYAIFSRTRRVLKVGSLRFRIICEGSASNACARIQGIQNFHSNHNPKTTIPINSLTLTSNNKKKSRYCCANGHIQNIKGDEFKRAGKSNQTIRSPSTITNFSDDFGTLPTQQFWSEMQQANLNQPVVIFILLNFQHHIDVRICNLEEWKMDWIKFVSYLFVTNMVPVKVMKGPTIVASIMRKRKIEFL